MDPLEPIEDLYKMLGILEYLSWEGRIAPGMVPNLEALLNSSMQLAQDARKYGWPKAKEE